MIITCEKCKTSFNLDENLLKPTGSKVRCSQCQLIFTAYPPSVPAKEELAAAAPPDLETEEKALAPEVEQADMARPTPPDGEGAEPAVDFQEDFQAEDEEAAGPDIGGMQAAEAMQIGIDLEPEGAAAAPTAEEDLDLSDLEGELEDEGGAVEEVPAAAGEAGEDLDLDFDLEPAEAAAAPDAGEELDLSDLEGALEMEEGAVEEAPAEAGEAAGDLDLDFDLEPAEAAAAPDAEEDLDLSDLEGALELEDGTVEEVPAAAGEAGEDLDLGLELEVEEAAPAPAEAEGIDDFDLDLDLDLEMEGDAADTPAASEEDLELDLDLEETELPGAPETSEGPSVSADQDHDLEDLDFELDMEFTDKETEAVAGPEIEPDDLEDLDLSDIEGLLEEREPDVLEAAETEKWKTQAEPADVFSETAELDLSDIEKMLDMEDEAEEAEAAPAEDLELDLEVGDETPEPEEALEMAEPEGDFELDISDLDEGIAEDRLTMDDPFESGDIELEFEVDDVGGADAVELEEEFDVPADMPGAEAAVATAAPPAKGAPKTKAKKAKKKKPKKPKPIGRRRGGGKGLLILLLLLLLGLGAIVYLDMMMGIKTPYVSDYLRQIPYVSDYLKPVAKDVGEIKVSEIESKFIDNVKSGKLLVITGRIKNAYPEPRSFIRIKGKLLTTGKTLAQSEIVYCGNILTDIDLANLDLAAIKKRLDNRVGDNKSNFKLKPGKELPFMVVFSNLPEDLEEFAVEAAGSVPGTAKK